MMMVSTYRIIIALVISVTLMMALSIFYIFRWLDTDYQIPDKERYYLVEKGSSIGAVASDLSRRRLLQWPSIWQYYARFIEKKSIKAGEYYLADQESPRSLLHKFQLGEVVSYKVTFTEGITFNDYLRILHSESKIRPELQGITRKEQLLKLKFPYDHPEGWFFPDTYKYERGDSDIDILRRAFQKMEYELAKQWAGRDSHLPYKDQYQALILASIVEKETGVGSERQEIAGVFVRRLLKGMRLQTDPTVIYGMGDRYRGNIRRKHLKEATPYNTYVIKGLPPTPIAMPGQKAIYAALHPAPGKSLYFVAKGDGYHQFSVTHKQHRIAVKKYQLRRRKDYQSVPSTKNQD